MIIPSHFRIALASLQSTRVRTALTTLGIVIGVTAITLVLSLGEGAKDAISRQITKLEHDLILIKPGRTDQQSAFSLYNPFSISPTSTLSERDYESISKQKDIAEAAPIMFISGSIESIDTEVEAAPIIATMPDVLDILDLTIRSGQFHDPTTSRDTVVLGEQLAIELLGTNQSRGQEIIIKGRPHTVIGIVKNTQNPINVVGVDIDRSAYITLENGKSFNQGITQIQQIIAKPKTDIPSAVAAAHIDGLLMINHDNERDFTVLEGVHAGEGANAFYNTIVSITAIVATIALIVGGVGIMNIMLVSVTERTREIGIRKALGATNSQILLQFLVEALVMTIIGGIIGLGLAYGAAFIISTFFAIQPTFTWQIVAVALGMAFSTGVIFGLFPALRASRKDPILALRQYQ